MIVHQQYRKRARSTKDCRDHLTTPRRLRLPAVSLRTYDYLHAEQRTARLYAEQGRKQAPSSTKNEVQAVVAAKWARTCVIYNRYTLTCIYIDYFFLCARSKRGSRHRRQRNKVEALAVVTYVPNKNTLTCISTGMDFFSSLRGAREEAGTGGDEGRRSKWLRTHVI